MTLQLNEPIPPFPARSDCRLARRPDELAADASRDGWSFGLTGIDDPTRLETLLLELASSLGRVEAGRSGALVEVLSPSEQHVAHPKSLSRTFGLRRLPLHTDGAHRLVPPRFVGLACINVGRAPAPTIVARLVEPAVAGPDLALLHSAVFRVRNGRASFFSSILDRSRSFVRFDRCCMIPVDEDGETAARSLEHHLEHQATRVDWLPGAVLLLDNWQILHGRGADATVASQDRKLLRVSVA